MEHKHAYL